LPLLIYQARVPVGRTILELPAGMLDDDDGDFVGTAAREVQCSFLLSEILISYDLFHLLMCLSRVWLGGKVDDTRA